MSLIVVRFCDLKEFMIYVNNFLHWIYSLYNYIIILYIFLSKKKMEPDTHATNETLKAILSFKVRAIAAFMGQGTISAWEKAIATIKVRDILALIIHNISHLAFVIPALGPG